MMAKRTQEEAMGAAIEAGRKVEVFHKGFGE